MNLLTKEVVRDRRMAVAAVRTAAAEQDFRLAEGRCERLAQQAEASVRALHAQVSSVSARLDAVRSAEAAVPRQALPRALVGEGQDAGLRFVHLALKEVAPALTAAAAGRAAQQQAACKLRIAALEETLPTEADGQAAAEALQEHEVALSLRTTVDERERGNERYGYDPKTKPALNTVSAASGKPASLAIEIQASAAHLQTLEPRRRRLSRAWPMRRRGLAATMCAVADRLHTVALDVQSSLQCQVGPPVDEEELAPIRPAAETAAQEPMAEEADVPEAGELDAGNFEAAGIEEAPWPQGIGISNAVGLASAEAHYAALPDKPLLPLIDQCAAGISGSGCMQEGCSGNGGLVGLASLRR